MKSITNYLEAKTTWPEPPFLVIDKRDEQVILVTKLKSGGITDFAGIALTKSEDPEVHVTIGGEVDQEFNPNYRLFGGTVTLSND